MKKLIIASMLFLSVSIPSYADVFYSGKVDSWSVIGETNKGEINTSCFYVTSWNDGSEFRVIFDIIDNETYILFKNNSWNISDDPGLYKLRMNFHRGDEVVGFNADYELLSKNTLRIRHVKAELFVPLFLHAERIHFVMEGTIKNATIPLRNTMKAASLMLECLEDSKMVLPKKNKSDNKKPSTNS